MLFQKTFDDHNLPHSGTKNGMYLCRKLGADISFDETDGEQYPPCEDETVFLNGTFDFRLHSSRYENELFVIFSVYHTYMTLFLFLFFNQMDFPFLF